MSKNEDFGMIPLESMAVGVPVITPDEGGYRLTIIDGKTGALLRDNSVKSLYNFLKNDFDKFLKNLHPDNLREQASKFSLETMEKHLKKIIDLPIRKK